VKLMQIMAVEYGMGRYFREAAAVAEQALALKTDDANIFLIAIQAYQDAADFPSALRIAEQMIRRFPDLARANFEYGYQLHRSGKPVEAMPYLKKAMAMDESYEEPFFFYGEVLLKEGRPEEAIPPLRKAIGLRRDYMAAWVTLARALMTLGRNEEARDELNRAVEINPRHPRPHLLLSHLYFRLGDEELAAREKEISLKLRREDPQAMESLQGRPFPERP
jgi:tetratricopeptide (TPR) repeat protein